MHKHAALEKLSGELHGGCWLAELKRQDMRDLLGHRVAKLCEPITQTLDVAKHMRPSIGRSPHNREGSKDCGCLDRGRRG